MSYISKTERINLYREIPKDAYQFIADKMGWGNKWTLPTAFSHSLSVVGYGIIKDHFEEWKRNHAFSSIKQNGVYDPYQHIAYYKALTSLINSEEYMLLSQRNKRLIVEEHKEIGRIIR